MFITIKKIKKFMALLVRFPTYFRHVSSRTFWCLVKDLRCLVFILRSEQDSSKIPIYNIYNIYILLYIFYILYIIIILLFLYTYNEKCLILSHVLPTFLEQEWLLCHLFAISLKGNLYSLSENHLSQSNRQIAYKHI